jgi:glutamate-1-semialdehyde 2,1-aminomutase
MLEGSTTALRAAGIETYGNVFGFKGSVVFSGTPSRNYREFLRINTAISHLHFLVQHNGGVFLPPWGKSESWTLSVAHTHEHGARYVRNVARVGELVSGLSNAESEIFAVGSYN